MLEPQDLPGRYGRVIRALDQLIAASDCIAVVAGGWAVWRHGSIGRVTQDVDLLVPADRVAELIRLAPFSGFESLSIQPERWPKLLHRETGIIVDLLAEGKRPGTAMRPAPTLLPHPVQSGGVDDRRLHYVSLCALIEMKLAAGRAKDVADIIELIRANRISLKLIVDHLGSVHSDYAVAFEQLIRRSEDETDQ